MDQIAPAMLRTCVSAAGEVKCWGHPIYGALGYGNAGAMLTDLSFGYSQHVCGREESALRCWGHNEFGQLGYGHTDDIGDDELPSSAGVVVYQ